MLPLLLALALVPADHRGASIDPRTTRAYDLATLTEAQAEQLQGHPGLFLVELDSLPGATMAGSCSTAWAPMRSADRSGCTRPRPWRPRCWSGQPCA